MPGGRPPDYSEEVLTKVKEYIDLCEDETKDVITGQSDKFTTYKEKIIVKLPTIEGLARFLKIHRDTVYDWENNHPEFSYILGELRAKQAEKLINSGLSGDYNPTIAKVLLTKHGYTEKQEVQHSLPEGQSFKIGGQTIQF